MYEIDMRIIKVTISTRVHGKLSSTTSLTRRDRTHRFRSYHVKSHRQKQFIDFELH
jgi:hypothetical protein